MINVDNRQTDLGLEEGWIEDLAEKAMELMDLSKYELSISFVNESEMTELNNKYLGKNRPTDVLAFPLADLTDEFHTVGIDENTDIPSADILGDVVICPSAMDPGSQNDSDGNSGNEDTRNESIKTKRIGKENEKAEVVKLLVHGILHLVGYDHYTKSEEKEMFALQNEIIEKLESQQVV